ncbi:polyamine aminopropyltransferase [Synechococcus sp. PCC 7336]|uniref:polyamine aminopropyltransferase n=1 Tax=Synechococcus sp. PCC 7336 TaxID=195250 RepID=UPI000346E020|nr:polyamine aminopropyltransferase [Synechococcus sp. PCC 7336]
MAGSVSEPVPIAEEREDCNSIALNQTQYRWLLAATAVSSGCGLAAELLLGTLASYLVGNEAIAYGVAVGGFLAAMGLGAYLSRYVASAGEGEGEHQQQALLLHRFARVELLLGPLTAALPLGLFALFAFNGSLWLGLVLATLLLGTLAGMEVPLLTRLVEPDRGVRNALAGVLALDYVGALIGSLAFPIVLLPLVGMFPAAALIGALPPLTVFALRGNFPVLRRWGVAGLAIGLLLLGFAPLALPLSDRLEDNLYNAPIVMRQQSPYQRIVLTRFGRDIRLFLDGDLQLSTLDEYRYHEALVHPAMSAAGPVRQVLVLGAGDGMAVREVLKWPQVERVVLVELDAAVIDLARHHPLLRQVNQGALDDPRVEIQIADAFLAAPQLPERFDAIVADFPDPDRPALAKLYSKGFYQRLLPRLAPDGVLVTQASTPFFAPLAIDCIATTLASTGLSVHPYTVSVPSFGPWGFVLASRTPIQPEELSLPVPTRFLSAAGLPDLFHLPADLELGHAAINRLSHPVLVGYQTDPEWAAYN